MSVNRRSVLLDTSSIRMDGDDILFDAVLATETPCRRKAVVDSGNGVRRECEYDEILPMSAVDLSRFQSNPVMLFGHNRNDLPIGRWEGIRISEGKLIATGRVTRTEGTVSTEGGPPQPASVLRKNIIDKTVRGVSVGGELADWIDVPLGDSHGQYRATERPARVAKSWCPFEFSIVVVPADVETLIRSGRSGPGRLIDHGVQPMKRKYAILRRDDLSPEQKPVGDDAAALPPADAGTLLAEIADGMPDDAVGSAISQMCDGMEPDARRGLLKTLLGSMKSADVVKFIKDHVPDAAKTISEEGEATERAYSKGFSDVCLGLPEGSIRDDFRRAWYGVGLDVVKRIGEEQSKLLARTRLLEGRPAGGDPPAKQEDSAEDAVRRARASAIRL